MFTWIPIHEETATRMLEFKDRQADLIDILARMRKAGLKSEIVEEKAPNGKTMRLKNIDPFTFLGNFNRRSSSKNRKDMWEFLKNEWGLSSDIPEDFEGIPITDARNSRLTPDPGQESRAHVSLLWELFEHIMDVSPPSLDVRLMQKCIDLPGIKLAMLSMGMFWACPRKWIATDAKNREFAATKGITDRPETAADYLAWLPRIREAIEGDGVEFSRQAHIWAVEGKSGRKTTNETDSPWWRRFFESEQQAHAAFDLIHDACVTLGVKNTRGSTSHRVSFTNIKEKGREWLRLNCANILVLQIGMLEAGKPNASFVMRMNEQQGAYIPQGRFAKPCKGHELGFCHADLADLLEVGGIARKLFFNALGDVAAAYSKITKRNFPKAHRPNLLRSAFKPASRIDLFENGPGPAADPQPPATVGTTYSKNDALRDLFMPEGDVDRAIAMLKRKKNVILQGAPGTGKTYVARRLAYLLMGEADPCRAPMVQFHQSTAYEDFIQGYRPDGNGGFEMKNGIFHEFCSRAADDEQGRPFVFIIDEINRGNLSKIFGEIMMLIESDKRGGDYAVPLAYATSQDETFHVPDNVFLIGTMNTADRSLSLVDYALRRRFAFLDMAPGFSSPAFESHLLGRGVNPKLLAAIRERMTVINDMIERDTHNLGKGYRIGHSFFVPGADVSPDSAWYDEVVHHEILPLLGEYWVDDEKSLKAAEQNLMGGIPE